MNNIIQIVTSPRFVQLLIVAILQALVLFNVITTEQGEGLINIISALLVGSVTIRTIDRQSDVKATAVVKASQTDVKKKKA